MPAANGERHYAAKLTWADVDVIRAAYAMGVRQCAIAKRYSVSRVMIHKIVTGKSWNKRRA